jgi:hypothetical protein
VSFPGPANSGGAAGVPRPALIQCCSRATIFTLSLAHVLIQVCLGLRQTGAEGRIVRGWGSAHASVDAHVAPVLLLAFLERLAVSLLRPSDGALGRRRCWRLGGAGNREKEQR